MSAWEEETRKSFKNRAERHIEAIRAEMITAVKNLKTADECQAIIRGTLRDPATALLSTEGLIETVKDMLVETRSLKNAAALLHENTVYLDYALTQRESFEKGLDNE